MYKSTIANRKVTIFNLVVHLLVSSLGPIIDLFDVPAAKSVHLHRIDGGEMFESTYPPTPVEQANNVFPPTTWY